MAKFTPQQLGQYVFTPRDYETLAANYLDEDIYAYLSGGSAQEQSLQDNRRALDELQLQPRLLAEINQVDSRITLFGETLQAPVLLAPVAYQGLVGTRAELDSAGAAKAAGVGNAISTLSSQSLEDIALQSPECRVFQLYLQPDDTITQDLIKRAQQAGYKAVMITLDAAIQSVSLDALRRGFNLHEHVEAANLKPYAQDSVSTQVSVNDLLRQAPSLKELENLLKNSPLPVWIKGVMHPQEAMQFKQLGVEGIVVSNHGGRALDGAPSPLRVLPAIRAAVGKDFPVLMDSGIRDGYDLFKALALGADAVMIGRLQIYSLGLGGAVGVAHMLKLLIEELHLCMAQTRCETLADIDKTALFNSSAIQSS